MGTYMESPDSYREDSCYFCDWFKSYENIYEDELEPADMGECDKHKKDVSYKDTCGDFDK